MEFYIYITCTITYLPGECDLILDITFSKISGWSDLGPMAGGGSMSAFFSGLSCVDGEKKDQ